MSTRHMTKMKLLIAVLFFISHICFGQLARVQDTGHGSRPVMAGWLYRKSVELVYTGGSTALSNQQINVVLNSTNFNFTHAMTNGEDIRFTTDDGTTLLDYWIQSYSSGSQTASIWVEVSNVAAFSHGYIFMYYGKSGSTSASSYANTMHRISADANTSILSTFVDGSGATVANTGTLGGTLGLVGGYTWNAVDIFAATGTSLSLNGTSGYVAKTGALDALGAKGTMAITFKVSSLTGTPRILSKTWRYAGGGSDYGDFFNLHIRSADFKLGFSFYKGTTRQSDRAGKTVVTANVVHRIVVVWSNENSTFYKIYMDGVLEIEGNFDVSALGTISGSAQPLTIGALCPGTSGGVFSAFMTGTLHEFALWDRRLTLKEIDAYMENRKIFDKNDISKWTVSTLTDIGGIEPNTAVEPSIMYDNGKFRLWYIKYGSSSTPTHTLWYTETTTIEPNVATTWSTPTVAYKANGLTAMVNNTIVRKFGSTYYLYCRAGTGFGPISVATSSDGLLFNDAATALANTASGFGNVGYYNCDVIYDPVSNQYKMIMEARDVSNIYLLGYATATSPLGPFTMVGQITGALPGLGTGNHGGPSLNLVDGKPQMWYHADPIEGIIPMELYRASSTNYSAWTMALGGTPFIVRERNHEWDQSSDVSVIEENGESYAIYNQMDNRTPFYAYLNIAKYNGPLLSLVTDFKVNIKSEQVL
jgi:hypothetical protein